MVSRRIFLASGTGWSLLQAAPSDTVRLGVVGAGGRGTYVMGVFQKDPALRVSAICDVYEPNLERGLGAAKKAGSKDVAAYRNYRELLADKNVDAVLIATPEHWHHRMVLDALAAGKDVYVEKPLCHTPEEGVELVDAEKRTRQIIQVGMQRRSYDLYQNARRVVQEGTLGTIRMVRSWWLNDYLGTPKAANLAGKLDWEQWQGPAAKREFDPERFLHWRYFDDYSGGILADQGAHVFDGIHMLMGATVPSTVVALAGKPHGPGYQTPESVVASAEYPEDFLATFTVNYGAMKYAFKNDQLNQLDGDKARMDIKREEFAVYPQGAEDKPTVTGNSPKGFNYATDLHVENFLHCVRTRERPTAPMSLGFGAALVVQMANISLRQGRRVRWNAPGRKVEFSV